MVTKKIPSYSVDYVSQQLDTHAIKNFIISDTDKKVPAFLLEYPHTLDGIAFSICVRGCARFKLNMLEVVVEPGTIVTILPNSIIEPVEKSADFFLEALLFSFDFISDLRLPSDFNIVEKIEQNPCLHVSQKEIDNLLKFHSFIVEQYNRREHPNRQIIAKCLLFALIAEIGTLYSTVERDVEKKTHAEKMTSRFYTLLRKHYKEERNISFYADKMCMSPKYLTSTIKMLTGKSVMMWIHEAVISIAKVELKSSDKTVLQISDELNFADASLFCRFFRKYTGMSPKEYRDSGVKVLIT